jgi:hypothetical protein
MKFIKSVVFASVASLLAVSAASAGTFEAYSMADQKSKRLVLVVSFASSQGEAEAQLDLDTPKGYKLVSAQAKVADTLCVQIPGNKIRIVPPSAGTGELSKASKDYCTFTFAAEKGLTAASKPVFTQSFIECASVSGIKSCNADIADITQ